MGEHLTEDPTLRQQLTRLRGEHEDQWSYRDRKVASGRTVLFQYPAMMVADMQRELTATLLDFVSGSDAAAPIFDPFVGSGTILNAGMALGRDVVGWDVNPMAILICQVKGGPFHVRAFSDAVDRTISAPSARRRPEERFANWRHWFTEDVALGLSVIRDGIRREPRRATRRFLWLCLAETVRLTSNSRTSTVKLHRRTFEQISTRPDPLDVFRRVTTENLTRLAEAADELAQADVLSRGGWYQGQVTLELGDTRRLSWKGPLSAVVVTSPPYGDNTSTVPYGQHAYLPLQWIDLEDIHPAASRDYLVSTYEIDRRSLGGIKRIKADVERALCQRSPALAEVVLALANERPDRRNRVLAFIRDFDDALSVIAQTVAPNGIAAWTVGSRRVGGHAVPLGQILVELAADQGLSHVHTLHRDIPPHRKRMAARNSAGVTMHREQVVVLRRVLP